MRSVGNRAKSVHAPIMKQLGSKANKREAGQKACIPFLIDGKRDRQLCASTYQETGGKQGRHHVRASGRLACKSSADLLLLLLVLLQTDAQGGTLSRGGDRAHTPARTAMDQRAKASSQAPPETSSSSSSSISLPPLLAPRAEAAALLREQSAWVSSWRA
eukprot:scaffold85273_cov14-Tisochrysis_lutea.AAC.1